MARRSTPKTPGLTKGHREIIKGLKAADVRVVSSVTDTYLGPLLVGIGQDPFFDAVPACSEEEAVTITAGAALAGRKSAAIFQNAGLFSSGRGIALAQNYHVPVLMLVSHRGDDRDPLYYHTYKGKRTVPLLNGLDVSCTHTTEREPLANQVQRAVAYVHEANQPFALLMTRRDLV
jgi:sulfopyruvate decarboxylase TPP-binding subunit